MTAWLFAWGTLGMLACGSLAGPPAPTPVPSPPVPPAPVSSTPAPAEPTVQLPSTLDPAVYARVRQDPDLGPPVDAALLPALLRDGAPAEVLRAFADARAAAIAAYEASVARGSRPAEPGPPTEGPRPGQVRRDFDAVCTDLVRGWFRVRADVLEARKDVAGLSALEAEVAGALPWDPVNTRLLAQELMLRRLAVTGGG